ncbi:MAG: TetR/AcrR family transcriptional regulator C-terminal domain-containing protein [Acutalibacteraceae bacterium]
MTHKEISLNTKKKLSAALKQAMKKKPFQKITVSELIKTCGINRNTFYYHFEDIYALLKWTLEYEAIEIVKSHNLITDNTEAISFVLDYVEKNDYILNCAYDSIGREELKRFFSADFTEIVTSFINQAEIISKKTLDASYKSFLSNFYVEALSGILINLIKENNLGNRSIVTKYLADTIKNSLMGILCSDNPNVKKSEL